MVHNYSIFWEKLSSDVIQVGGGATGVTPTVATGAITTVATETPRNNGTRNVCMRESYSLELIKSHG